jgi:hypothetical protein
MSVFGIIFWLWLTVSVVILVQRRLKRRVVRRAGGVVAPPGSQAAGDTGDESTTDVRGTGGGPGGGADPAPVDDQVEAVPLDSEAPTADHDQTEGSTSSAPMVERTDDSIPAAPTTRMAGPGGRVSGIAEALSGIQMPCDLAPLTLGVAGLDPVNVDLVTTGVGPGEVAAQLDSELTRLGYEVTDLGAGEQLATRGETVVRVKVHDRPALSVRADGRGFPNAPSDSIVVELTVA